MLCSPSIRRCRAFVRYRTILLPAAVFGVTLISMAQVFTLRPGVAAANDNQPQRPHPMVERPKNFMAWITNAVVVGIVIALGW